MTDFSAYTDDQLQQLYQQQPPGPVMDPAHPLASAMAADAPANANVDLSQLTDAQLQALHATQPVPQIEGWQREAALPASYAAKGALTSAGSFGDLAAWYSRTIGAPAENAILRAIHFVAPGLVSNGHAPPAIGPDNPIASPTLLSAGRALGAIDRPDLQPQNLREEYEAAAAQGAGAAAPWLLTGGAEAIPGTLIGGAAGGVGAKFGEDIAPSHPILGPLVGATAGMLGGSSGYSLAAKGFNAVRGAESDLAAAYRRMNMDPRLVGDVTGSTAAQQYQSYLAKSLGGAGTIEHAAQAANEQFGSAIDRTAETLGGSRTGMEAGGVLQDEARTWINQRWPAAEAAAWAPVNAKIPKYALVPLTNYKQALDDITGQIGRLQSSGQVVLPQKAQDLLAALQKDLAPIPGSPAGLMPAQWDEAQRLRAMIGEARGIPEISQSLGSKTLSRLYAAISADMRGTASAVGVGPAFDAANAFSTAGHNFMERTLAKIVSAPRNPLQETISPAQAADNVLNGGDQTLMDARSQLPHGTNELAAWKLRDAGLATPGRQNASGQQISPNTFLTDISALEQRAPHGFKALYGGVDQEMSDLRQIAGGMRLSSTKLNYSNTGQHGEFASIWPHMLVGADIGKDLGGEGGAALGAVIGGGAAPLANRVGAAAMTSPTVARFLSTPSMPWTARQSLIGALAPAYALGVQPVSGPSNR